MQGVLLAAVYAIGLGRLSKGLALLSEAVALCIDAGLHRSVDQYDYFDPIETEVRKRTFWSGLPGLLCSPNSSTLIVVSQFMPGISKLRHILVDLP